MIEWLEAFFRSIAGFIVLMGLLVTIHEYGHFYVARKLGFAVTKFSIGFGKSLWSRKGKDGIEYAICMIPLGGYVLFVDDEEEQKESLNGMRFNEGKIWQKTAVVAAGPLANILLAIVLLWGLFLYGVPAYKPYIDVTEQNAPFAQAGLQSGDLIISINGDEIDGRQMLLNKLIEHLGDGRADILYERNGALNAATLDIGGALQLDAKTDFYKKLGFYFYMLPSKPVIKEVLKDGNLGGTGINVGDVILSINQDEIKSIPQFLKVVSELKDQQAIEISVDQNGVVKTFNLNVKADDSGKVMLGVAVGNTIEVNEQMVTKERLGFFDAGYKAVARTLDDGIMVFKFVGRMLKGDFHINTMSGPVSIANIAGHALVSGLVSFIGLVAMLSVNIGVLNLLPIPVLDGGRLVGFGIEKIMGKHQFSDRIKIIVLNFGAIVMFIFMAIVIGYDVVRWF